MEEIDTCPQNYLIKMKITEERKKELEAKYQQLLHDPKVAKMKEVPMHRGSNCYIHSFRVAKRAVHSGLKKRKPVNLEAILVAAILHDYYLYDWRTDKSKRKHHGRRHPYIAAEHAVNDFGVDDLVKKVIESHMWPMNFKEYPHTKEAKILSISDKGIAIREALCSKKHKQKNWHKYEKMIAHLFE